MDRISAPYKRYIIGGTVLIAAIVVLCVVVLHHRTSPVQTSVPTTTAGATTPDQTASAPAQTAVVSKPSAPVEIIPDVTPLPAGTDRFVVSLDDTNATISDNLASGAYITDASSFQALLDAKGTVAPGGYKISTSMSPSQLVAVLYGKPYMAWVVIPEGLRKEEIAALLGTALDWSQKTQAAWIKSDPDGNPNYIEGVYFPNTYLIPIDESPDDVATRLIDKFNEEFAPDLSGFQQQNIKWTTGLTLASIVQREASSDADMPLIAGILWNRLNQGMALDVDATLQYARGNTGAGWWAPITVADKQIDSPYNTYMYKGLPPHPISNPGLAAINAVLNPTTTDCLYYIHDSNRVTHCAATYPEQEANIQTYLIDPTTN